LNGLKEESIQLFARMGDSYFTGYLIYKIGTYSRESATVKESFHPSCPGPGSNEGSER
jgi:hypothetical protein